VAPGLPTPLSGPGRKEDTILPRWATKREIRSPFDKLAKGFALDIPAGYGGQKSGARSQNGGGVRAEEPTDFFQGRGQWLGVSLSEVLGENEKVTAFLHRSLGHIQAASLVGFAATPESLGDGRLTHSERNENKILVAPPLSG